MQRKFLESEQDIVFFGGGAGGGKTWAALIDNFQGIHCPNYFSVFFRTTTTEISNGIWPEVLRMSEPILKDSKGKFIGKAHINNQGKVITWPSGARTAFAYLELDKHSDAWYGSEITKIYFEEFQFRSYYQFDVLRSRNRSVSEIPCGIRCTLNPDPTHFVYDFVKLFLDEDFFPIKELSGKTAYFTILQDVLHTSWDKQELVDKFGKNPQTYTYIPATVDDNKHLDSSYRDRLDSMSEKKRKQLLLGCWAPVEDTGMYFQRSMFREASAVPLGSRSVRGWDTAGTAPDEGQEVNRYADWTVGIKMSKCQDGDYYIHGMERFQDRAGPRDRKILKTGHRDGQDCHIVMAADVGSAGNFQFQEFAKKASEDGLICKKDPMPVNKSKLTRAEPFAVAAQNGFVYIVESSFHDGDFEIFMAELERFDGERSKSNTGKWDDIVDAASSAFNFLAGTRSIRIVPRNQQHNQTIAAGMLQSNNVSIKDINKPDDTNYRSI